jgi:hypothetical protein
MTNIKKDNLRYMPRYRGIPIVRHKDTIYYGDISKPYVICVRIKNTEIFKDMRIATKVGVQLVATDPNLSPGESIIKSSEKNGLFSALDVAEAWLSRALQEA